MIVDTTDMKELGIGVCISEGLWVDTFHTKDIMLTLYRYIDGGSITSITRDQAELVRHHGRVYTFDLFDTHIISSAHHNGLITPLNMIKRGIVI